ncbi:MAG: DUF3298 and DUF4163 domain-containing protein [Sarcina sp.]
MKKILFCLGFFLLTTNIFAMATPSGLNIKPKSLVEKDNNIDVSVNYPTVDSTDQKVLKIFDDINGVTLGWVNKLKSEAESDQFDKQYIVKSDFKVPYNSNGILSLTIDNYVYLGGAHGVPTILTYNYNSQTGEKLTLGDLFKDGFDYKTFLNTEIKKDINKNKDLYFSGNDGFKGIKEDQDFYITSDGLVVVFQVYQIAPYASGIIYFNIPKENIESNVKLVLFK